MTLFRRIAPTLLLVVLALASSVADAAPRDAAATKKIDEAINTHYLQTNFDKAESVLLGVVQACEDKCSPGVKAKAWMYIGIVRGSGRADMPGATDAFLQAVLLDPGIQLDDALATPETKQAFDSAKSQGGGGASPTPPAPSSTPSAPTAAAPLAGTMQCTPTVRELQTRRAIPISCDTPQPTAAKGVVFYKEFGGDDWKEVPMVKKGTSLQGTVPCEATALAGRVQVYVEGRDANGNVVDMLGTRAQPLEFTVLGATNQPPPAFPGMEAPPRCEEKADCPPDFPGCKGNAGVKEWGDSCGANDECQTNYCASGSCEFCQTNADCPDKGTCNDGFCSGGSGGGSKGGRSSPGRKIWVGGHLALDVPVIGGENVCTRDSQANEGWNCFYPGPPPWRASDPSAGTPGDNIQYPYNPHPNASGKVNSGLSLATIRALLSFDYALKPNISLGARAGFAFNGGPKAAGASFIPVHAEGRVTYWFIPLSRVGRGIRPYVHLGGGLGQIDVKMRVKVLDCNLAQYEPSVGYAECVADLNYDGVVDVPLDPADVALDGTDAPANLPRELELDAYRRMGTLFVAPGFGMVYAISSRAGIQFNVDTKILFPTTGFAFSPSLGFVFGL